MELFKGRHHKTLYFFFIIFAFFYSCAQIVAPTGGEKDISPPKVVKSKPANGSTNFSTRRIEISFDEFILLKDLNSQLIISPPLEERPDIKVKNKTLVIDIAGQLKPNTTYNLSFGNAVRDITEENPVDLKYIFSTGNVIDTLSFTGKAEFSFNKKPENKALIMLYDDFADSVPYKKRPSYFAKTAEDGKFTVTNLPKGEFKAFALKDTNDNYFYDSPDEKIGFIETPVKSTDSIHFFLFKEKLSKQFLKHSIMNQFGLVKFVFNIPVDTLIIRPLNIPPSQKPFFIMEYSAQRDTVNYWYNNIEQDSLRLEVRVKEQILDTIKFKLLTKEKPFVRGGKLQLLVKPNITTDRPFDLNKDIILEFSHPIKEYDPDKITVRNNISGPVACKETTTGKSLRKLVLTCPLQEDSTYQLYIPPGTFKDIFDLVNDTVKIDFRTQRLNYYGTSTLHINVPEEGTSYILQLLDEKENMIRENYITNNTDLSYEYLEPGKYRLKVIYDGNNNGKWDTGNYLEKKQPEKVNYYPSEINIRGSWDIEVNWSIP